MCSCFDSFQKNVEESTTQRERADAYTTSSPCSVRGITFRPCFISRSILTRAQLYDGPHPEWLRDVLEQLPNLQSLIVSHLPFFDHMALLALRSHSDGRRSSIGSETPPMFTLRLLVASYCQNTTPQGLAEALDHFPYLAYLDLSNTLAARDSIVLAKMGTLPQLQVLKLRNVHLRDEGMASLANAIGIRVRSLDVSENELTDQSIRTLLGSCFDAVQQGANGSSNTRHRSASNMPVEDWPAGFVRPDPAVLDEFRDESYDERFVRRLTSKVVSRLPFEDLPQSGITHLYISNNQVSVEGLAALIRSEKLHVLDAAAINTVKAIDRPFANSISSSVTGNNDHLNVPGLEKLTPVLIRCGQSMTSLRIDFSLVTTKAPILEDKPPLAVCELPTVGHQQPQELAASTHQIAELNNTEPPTYELDSVEIVPAYELPAEPLELSSRITPLKSKLSVPEPEQRETRRGSAFSPEVVEHQDGVVVDEPSPVLTATGLSSMAQATNGMTGSAPSFTTHTNASIASLPTGDPNLSLALIEKQRKDLHTEQEKSPFGLKPYMLPKLRTITLTDVPCYEAHHTAVDALIAFINSCASEANLALDEARLKPATFRKANQLDSRKDHHQKAREIFPLQRIVLEMAPTEAQHVTRAFSPQTSRSAKSIHRTLSSTEDADSEALWSASENDFTFFDNQEECGLPASETGTFTHMPLSALPEKIAVSADEPAGSSIPPPTQRQPYSRHTRKHNQLGEEGGPTNVVAELAAFRKERKVAFENAAARGIRHVEGYWSGEVKVVREHKLGPSIGGRLDYYGNYFERGVYR